MKLTDRELEEYHDDGFVMLRRRLPADLIDELRAGVPDLLGDDPRGENSPKERDDADGMHRTRERNGHVRQVYLAHRHHATYRELVRNPKVLEPARQILGNDVYVWHSKLNTKRPFEGTAWLWHQDYGYWYFDGVQPKLVTAIIFMDPSTTHNGCLVLARGSHKWGRQEHVLDETTTSYRQYGVDFAVLRERLREEDIYPVIAEPGDLLLIHCNLVHGSGQNMSPLPRRLFCVAYNDVNNRPVAVDDPRPDWVVSRRYDPVR